MFSVTWPGFLVNSFGVSSSPGLRRPRSASQPALPRPGAGVYPGALAGAADRFERGTSAPRLRIQAASAAEDSRASTRAAEKAYYIQLQQAAEQRRRAMPALFQLLYPLKGTVVGIKSTEMMEREIAQDPVLSQLNSTLTPAAEQRFLRHFAWLFSLSQEPKSDLRSTVHQTLLQVEHPVMRDAMVAYLSGHSDPDVRRTALQGVPDVQDPVRRDALIQALGNDSDWQNRASAASMIALLSGADLRDAMIGKLLSDPNLEVRRMTARAVKLVQSPECLSQCLSTMINDPGWEVRLAAAENLHRLPDGPQRKQFTHQLSRDHHEEVRAVLLGQRHARITHPDVLGAYQMKPQKLRDLNLAELSHRLDATARLQSALVLDAIQDTTLRDEAIEQLFQDELVSVRRAAIQALPLLSNAQRRDRHLASLVDDAYINTRIMAAQLCPRIEDPHLRDKTVQRLFRPEEHWMVRREAMHQLAKLPAPQMVLEWLTRLRSDHDPEIRRLAVLGLSELPDSVVRDEQLAACLRNKDTEVRKAAVGMLPRISDLALRDRLLEHSLKDASPQVQRDAIRQLSLFRDADFKDRWIQKLIRSGDASMRKFMVRSVSSVSNLTLRDSLIVKLLQDPEKEVRLTATGLIELLQDSALRDHHLEAALASDQELIRHAAIGLLPLLSNPSRRDALIVSSAEHPFARVRQAAARLIPEISDESLQRACLQKLLKDPESTVRLLAVQALGVLVNDSLQAISPDAYLALFQKGLQKEAQKAPSADLAQSADAQAEVAPAREIFPGLLAAFHGLRQSGLDGGELLKLMIEFGKVNAHVVRRREHFVIEDEPAQGERQIQNYLNDHLVPILNGITLAGRGSVMDKFDQKPNKFEQYLATVNRLTQEDELTTMLAQVCRLPNLKGLRNSADYHKIIELSDGYRHIAKQDQLKHYLQGMQEKQMVNPQQLAHGYLKRLAERCGMDAAEVAAIPKVHLNAWNIPYVHLIPSALRQLPPHNQEQLMEMYKSTLTGRFADLLHDPETHVGQVNRDTRAAFESENLNFETWLNYDKKRAFNTYQHPLELQLWQRQPGHDLFQGTYAQSCVSLDNLNGQAIVEALLHHCVQMLEVRDVRTRQPIGKVLLYWAKDQDRHEPVLVADNVQFREGYQHSMQTREVIRRWLAEYGQAVAGKPVTVLLGSRYNRIPSKDLESRPYNLKVLGDTESHEFYLNSLSTGWSDLRKTHPVAMFRLSKP